MSYISDIDDEDWVLLVLMVLFFIAFAIGVGLSA